jgi:hypothetical protein
MDKKLDQILNKETSIMATLDDIVASVAAEDTVVDSVVTLLAGIKAQLDAAGQNPAKLQALSDALANQQTKMANAIVANTPAVPPVPPGP